MPFIVPTEVPSSFIMPCPRPTSIHVHFIGKNGDILGTPDLSHSKDHIPPHKHDIIENSSMFLLPAILKARKVFDIFGLCKNLRKPLLGKKPSSLVYPELVSYSG